MVHVGMSQIVLGYVHPYLLCTDDVSHVVSFNCCVVLKERRAICLDNRRYRG